MLELRKGNHQRREEERIEALLARAHTQMELLIGLSVTHAHTHFNQEDHVQSHMQVFIWLQEPSWGADVNSYSLLVCFCMNATSCLLFLVLLQFEYWIYSCTYLIVSPLLTDAPALSAVTESDVESFLSPSGSIAARARNAHNEMLQANRLPWWKTLGESTNTDMTCSTHPQETEVEPGQQESSKTELTPNIAGGLKRTNGTFST